MVINSQLIESIKKHEGFRSRVYNDSLGKPTIGYGFLIEALDLDEDICLIILQRKLDGLIRSIKFKFGWFEDMPEKVQNVIVNMSYQLGLKTFGTFKKTIEHFKKREWELGSEEMLRSKWFMQTPNRAKELSEIIKSTKEEENGFSD